MTISNFYKQWLEFKKTKEYKDSCNAMKAKGIKQPYRDNILMSAFTAGWRDRKIVMLKKSI